MGTTRLDDRGRVTIPKELRERLGLRAGDTLDIDVESGEMRLSVEREGVEHATRGEEWGAEAFLDAGEATFGDR